MLKRIILIILICATNVAMSQNPQIIRKTIGTSNDTTFFGVNSYRSVKIENIGSDSVFTYIPDRDGKFSSINYIGIGKGEKIIIKFDGIKIISKGKSAGTNIIMYINDVDVIRKTSLNLDTALGYHFTHKVTIDSLYSENVIKASDFPNSYVFSDSNGFYPKNQSEILGKKEIILAVSQTGEQNPSITVLKNDFVGVTITATRNAPGTYYITASDTIFSSHTYLFVMLNNVNFDFISPSYNIQDTFNICIYLQVGSVMDGNLRSNFSDDILNGFIYIGVAG